MLLGAGFEGRLEQADVAGAGVAAQRLQRGAADAALGHGDGADEGRIVVAVGDQAQVGDQVLDLGLLEKALPARDGVGNLLVAQLLFEHPRLVVAAIEDGVVAPAGAVLELVRLQLHHHQLGLVLGVLRGGDGQRVAGAVLAPQALVEQLGVVGDQRVGGLEDALHRAVVLLELDHLEARVVALQGAQVLAVRAAPGVDGLFRPTRCASPLNSTATITSGTWRPTGVDRRKDLALQCEGYPALRFLAEDVVARFRKFAIPSWRLWLRGVTCQGGYRRWGRMQMEGSEGSGSGSWHSLGC